MKSVTPLNIINLIDEKILGLSSLMEKEQSSENQSLFFKLKKNNKKEIIIYEINNTIRDLKFKKYRKREILLTDIFDNNIINSFFKQIDNAFQKKTVDFQCEIQSVPVFITLIPITNDNELTEIIAFCRKSLNNENKAKEEINQLKQYFYSLRQEIESLNNEKGKVKDDLKSKKPSSSFTLNEQELLNQALSFAKTGLWRIDFEKKKLKLSSQLLEILEMSKRLEETDLIGLLELVHIDDRSRVQADYNSFIRRKRKVFDTIFRIKKKTNDWVWIKCVGQSYFEKKSSNLPSLIFGIAYDINSGKTIDLEKDRLISELKKSNFAAEETALEIIEMYQELAESEKYYIEMNQKKDELFSILSTELQSSILGFLSLSNLIFQEYHNFSKEEIKDAFKEINISSKNLFDFLENVLLWTQIQNKKIDYKPNFFYLKDIINESLILFSNVIQNKELTVENKVDEKIVVFVDYDMINSLFRNLVSNAIKFSKKHSKILLDNKMIEAKSSFVEISVKDEGIGIDEKAKKYIFTFNKKVIRRGCDNEVGSGLGLVLCKEFIKYHKGKIQFKSKKQEGTTFYFTLPLVRV